MGMYRMSFVAGFAAGFVVGARSGRETYDQIAKYARNAFEHPTVKQARGTVQAQATGLAQKVGGQIADKMPQVAHSAAQSVTGRIPGMRQRTENGDKQETEAGTFATSSGGTPGTGPDLT